MDHIDPQLQAAQPQRFDGYGRQPPTAYNSFRLPPISPSAGQLQPLPSSSYYQGQQLQPPHVQSPADAVYNASSGSLSLSNVEIRDDLRRSRACEACRGLKVRCDLDPAGGPCKRCAKANRACIITEPSRKRQKKSDTRVADLERKIDALTATLYRSKGQGPDGNNYADDDNPAGRDSYGQAQSRCASLSNAPRDYIASVGPFRSSASGGASYMTVNPQKRRSPPGAGEECKDTFHPDAKRRKLSMQSAPVSILPLDPMLPHHDYADAVDRQILDMPTAEKIFEYYVQNMTMYEPCVVFTRNTQAAEIRRNKPLLFLAILSVACIYDFPDLKTILLRERKRALADAMVVRGEKSLELIQALQIAAIWQ